MAAVSLAVHRPASAQSAYINVGSQPKLSRIRLTIDKSRTIQLSRAVSEALVAQPNIADVVPLTSDSLYVIGKKIGLTRLTLLDERKALVGVVEIEVSYDISALRSVLRQNIPNVRFKISTAQGRILLGGEAPDSVALSRANEIAKQFAPDGFLNTMTVQAPQQVLLEVRFVEASRRAGRDLGISTRVRSSKFRGITGPRLETSESGGVTGAALLSPLLSNSVPFGSFLARVLEGGTTADVLVRALEKRGLARRLAEPNLVTLSGTPANFLAGGEVPYQVDAGDNRTAIEWKRYGIELAFTPTVLANGKISLKINPSVSDLDYSNAVRGQPALTTRSASATVELRDGQSFAMAGLLLQRHSKNVQQLPWIGRVPVLGALFRSAAYQKDETDLVILVTPRLVQPARPGEKLATPLDTTRPSNDKRFFVSGELEHNIRPRQGYGHILDESGGWEVKTIARGAKDGTYK